MKRILIGIIGVLVVALAMLVTSKNKLNAEYERTVGNFRAIESQYANANLTNRSLVLKVNQLEYLQDSLIHKMDSVRKQLKIKDKDVKSMHYIHSTVYKTDTVQLSDTVFRDRNFELDSIIGDAWYRSKIHLKYPNFIVMSPEFVSKKHIIVSAKKETVDPPKKFFLLRWFQKKHIVLKVDVVEESPYVRDSVSRFIEFIK